MRGASVAALGACLLAAAVGAQDPPPPIEVEASTRRCDADTISTITIHAFPPSGIDAAARVLDAEPATLRRLLTTTRAQVLHSYLRLSEGAPCTERARQESERLLRSLRFVASAAVRALPDGPGRVRIAVLVVDEFPWVVGARARDGTLIGLSGGTGNLLGRGITMVLGATRGLAYRDGVSLLVSQVGLFRRPAFVTLSGERLPLGGSLGFEMAEPFVSDLKRHAWHFGAQDASGYAPLLRPADPDVALVARRFALDAGYVRRIGLLGRFRGRRDIVGLVGAAAIGEGVRTSDRVVIVSDSGLVTPPGDPTLDSLSARYPAFAASRLALVGGVRALRFTTVRGFDGLRAEQDVGQGMQVVALAGPTVVAARDQRDIFVALDAYGGRGDARVFTMAHLLAEARALRGGRRWEGGVASARVVHYRALTVDHLRLVRIDGAILARVRFPVQLTMRDAQGGIGGLVRSPAAGGQRLTVHVEDRWLLPWWRDRGDAAVAVFGDVGRLWRGDVPFGATSPVRGALGLSLLAAYPSRGHRAYRLDLAVPLNPEPGRGGLQLRLSASDGRRALWGDPGDVARARSGAFPVSLFRW